MEAGSDAEKVQRIKQTATGGFQGTAQPLPHRNAIQQSFGHHGVGGVETYIGGQAAKAARSMGATAYTCGNRVAFSSSPDLWTAAHEAAHVVQQRSGISLQDGAGRSGDEYERHADAVADRVVAGESAEPILDRVARSMSGESRGLPGKDPGLTDESRVPLLGERAGDDHRFGRGEPIVQRREDESYPDDVLEDPICTLALVASHPDRVAMAEARRDYLAEKWRLLIELEKQPGAPPMLHDLEQLGNSIYLGYSEFIDAWHDYVFEGEQDEQWRDELLATFCQLEWDFTEWRIEVERVLPGPTRVVDCTCLDSVDELIARAKQFASALNDLALEALTGQWDFAEFQAAVEAMAPPVLELLMADAVVFSFSGAGGYILGGGAGIESVYGLEFGWQTYLQGGIGAITPGAGIAIESGVIWNCKSPSDYKGAFIEFALSADAAASFSYTPGEGVTLMDTESAFGLKAGISIGAPGAAVLLEWYFTPEDVADFLGSEEYQDAVKASHESIAKYGKM